MALQVSRFVQTLPEPRDGGKTASRPAVAVSPDGRRFAFSANQQLYVRELAGIEATPVAGSFEKLLNVTSIAFSPDGRSIAYQSIGENVLRRIPANGGRAVTVCEAAGVWAVVWHGDHLLFAARGGIMRVSAEGGAPEVIVRLARGEVGYGPQVLPGGKYVLYSLAPDVAEDMWAAGEVVVQKIGSNERTVVLKRASSARYLPTGHIVYESEGVVFAVPFAVDRLQILGNAVPVIEGVHRGPAQAGVDYAVSDTGTLVYVPVLNSTSTPQYQLSEFDRTGQMMPTTMPPASSPWSYAHPRASRDGRRIAYSRSARRDINIWVIERSGAGSPRQLTFDGDNRHPVWSADSTRVAFQSTRDGDGGIYWQVADGSRKADRLTRPQTGNVDIPQSASPDGRHLLYDVVTSARVSLWALSLRDGSAVRFGGVMSDVSTGAAFSPDGRWVSYSERVGARSHVYVQPFPATGAKYLVSDSLENAHHPAWSSDGRELFYTPGPVPRLARVVMTTSLGSVQFTASTPFPRRFQNLPPTSERPYDVTPDGRFLGIVNALTGSRWEQQPSRLHVVLNWFEELRAIAPPR